MPRFPRAALIAAAWAGGITPAYAHGGEHAAGGAGGWSIEPLAAGLVLVSLTFYASGYWRMTPVQRRRIAPLWRVAAYAAAVAILIAALFSPIDAYADSSFAWHMSQHLLLMLGAGPLLALANIHLVALMALPLGPRRRVGGAVNRAPGVRQGASSRAAPAAAALAFAAGLWLWHAPRLYEAALADPVLHTLEHLTFVATSAVYWRMMSTVGNRRLDGLSAIVLVTLVALQGNLLAALITLAPQPLYVSYAANRLSDQQIAGLLMWVPAGAVYLAATLRALHQLVRHAPKMRKAGVENLRFRSEN